MVSALLTLSPMMSFMLLHDASKQFAFWIIEPRRRRLSQGLVQSIKLGPRDRVEYWIMLLKALDNLVKILH